MESEPHRRELPTGSDRDHFVLTYTQLSEAGLAPEIIGVTATEIATRRHGTLTNWLLRAPPEKALYEMGCQLVERIEALHATGICHRDLHDGNIVLRGELPLFIDPAFAITSDPASACYDLDGPKASGVPVAPAHASQNDAHRCGVWWDAPIGYRTLSHHFGPISRYRS